MNKNNPRLSILYGICRLCLSYCPETVDNLFENVGLYLKVTACFSIKISDEEHLPYHVCANCISGIDQTYNFHTKVVNNQNKLNEKHKNKDILDFFYKTIKDCYLIIKDIKHDVADVGEIENEAVESKNEVIENLVEDDIFKEDIKTEKEEEEVDRKEVVYSSDDNLTLSTIKETTVKTTSCKKNKRKVKKKKGTESKENFKEKDIVTESKSQIEIFKCLTCFELFNDRKILLKHYKTVHGPKEKGNNDNIQKYSVDHVNGAEVFKCKLCSKVYSARKRINGHLNTAHLDKRPYTCNMCGRTFKLASDISRHGTIAHGEGVRYQCSYKCGYSTPYKAGWASHEKLHRKEFKYKCEKCGKGFQVKTWFDEHQNEHTGAKPYVCDICGVAYHLKRYLVRHRSTAHPQSQALKKYVCVRCSLPCDSMHALQLHSKDVHGIKSAFLCDICGKEFNSSVHLSSHKAFHLNIRPHTCSLCSKSFTTRDHLKRHQRCVHAGQRAHACEECGKRYSQSYSLNKHKERHHSVSSHKREKKNKVLPCAVELNAPEKDC